MNYGVKQYLLEMNQYKSTCLLQTHEVDLKSKLGMRLKRQMLLSLARKDLYPNNAEKRHEVYEKYKEFVIPVSTSVFCSLA